MNKHLPYLSILLNATGVNINSQQHCTEGTVLTEVTAKNTNFVLRSVIGVDARFGWENRGKQNSAC